MQKQPYFGRNNCLSAEIRIFRQKLLFWSNTATTWPGLCIQTAQICDAGWREEFIYMAVTYHTGTSWCRDCYSIFQLTCPKRRRGWRQIWGPGSLEWNKAQLIVCVDHLDIFLSMTLEWQPRPFPFKICYDVIVKCHVHQRCDAEPTCIKF